MWSVILADLFNIPFYSAGIIFSIFFNTFWGSTHQCYHFILCHTFISQLCSSLLPSAMSSFNSISSFPSASFPCNIPYLSYLVIP